MFVVNFLNFIPLHAEVIIAIFSKLLFDTNKVFGCVR